jgi:hypothetical protein
LWDKNVVDTIAADSFKVYSQILSNWTNIGAVSIHSPSEFIDNSSTPDITSNLYKLSYIDHCGNESPLSDSCQTILLQASIGVGNTVNLSWNKYIGEPVNYYVILRDSTGLGNWQHLDSVSNTIFDFIDNNPPASTNLRYVICTNWNLSCTPTLSIKTRHNKVLSINQQYSLSNIKEFKLLGIKEINCLSGIEVYPVPALNNINIDFGQPLEAKLSIENILGETVYSENNKTYAKETAINISMLTSGIYILKIESENSTVYKRIIKM